MEQLKDFVSKHRALAIGGGIAFVILLYLWLRSGSSTTATQAQPSQAGLQAYYQAQATSANDTATTAAYTDQLAAATNQTNAEETVALAQTREQAVPYQAQLDALTQELNLTAYQDYLGEVAGTTATGSSSIVPGTNANYYEGTSIAGNTVLWSPTNNSLTNPATGQVESGGNQSFSWDQLPANWNASPMAVNWNGIAGSAPTAAAKVQSAAPLQFGQFTGVATPQLTTTSATAGNA